MKLNDVHMYHVQHCAVTLWRWGYSNLKLICGYGDDSICDGASKIHLGGLLRFRGIIDKFSSGRISTEKRMNYEEDTYEFLVLTKKIHVKLKVVCRPQAC